MKANPLLVVIVLAIIAAVAIIVTGHAADGAGLLATLFTVIGLAGGGHLANPPDTSTPPAAAPDSTIATKS
jgi:hypothetical protein